MKGGLFCSLACLGGLMVSQHPEVGSVWIGFGLLSAACQLMGCNYKQLSSLSLSLSL